MKYFEYKPKEKESFTIFLYHGWGMKTSSLEDLAELLSGEGIRVILPEIINHDSRRPLENPFEQKVLHQYFWPTICQTIDEAGGLFAECQADPGQTLVIGSSMGGFIASGIMARHDDLAGGAVINGSGAFVFSESLFREMQDRPEMSEEESEKLRAYDPAAAEPPPFPLLLLHGELDAHLPISMPKTYAGYLAERNKENLTFNTYPKVNHTISGEMIRDLLSWLRRLDENRA